MKRNKTPNNFLQRFTKNDNYKKIFTRPKSNNLIIPKSAKNVRKEGRYTGLGVFGNDMGMTFKKTDIKDNPDHTKERRSLMTGRDVNERRSKSPMQKTLNGEVKVLSLRQQRELRKQRKASTIIQDDDKWGTLKIFFDKAINEYTIAELKEIHKEKIVDKLLNEEEDLIEKHEEALEYCKKLDKKIEPERVRETSKEDKVTVLSEIYTNLEKQKRSLLKLKQKLTNYKQFYKDEKTFRNTYLTQDTSSH